MLNEELQEKLLSVFDKRFQDYNTKVLEELGNVIKQFKDLTPSQAYKLSQQLKYNTTVKQLLNELSKISGLSVKDLKVILEKVAKENIGFADVYYKARGLETPIYSKNKALQRLVSSVYSISGTEFKNIAKSTGFRLLGDNGEPLLLNIDETYKYVIDKCVVAISQGKETYQQSMRSTLKQLSSSGVRKIEYESGYSRRLDTSIRMNILDSMRQVSNESQQLFGKEFDSDGVEISVHLNPAPDHELVQGRQFSNKEFENFQNDRKAVDYTGMVFEPEFEGYDRRSISEYNCYHYIFSIVLGVSKPQYSNEQLQEIIDSKNKTFEFDGKTYNMYEGTQLQRRIESAIRQEKDTQILAKASGDDDLVLQSQTRITQLTTKYKQLCNTSGLPNKLSTRASVSGYRRTKINKTVGELKLDNIDNISRFVNSNKESFKNLDVKELQLKINEKYHFNDKPTLLSENDFDRLEEIDNYNKPGKSEEKDKYIKVFRGWGDEKYSEEYKYGKNSYGEGGFIDGVGTYATDNEPNAWAFANEEKDKFMEIAIPNNVKFVTREDLANLHFKIYEEYNNKRDIILKKYGKNVVEILDVMNENISSTAVLNKYDIIVNQRYRNWVILNRSKIIIKNN